MAWVAGVWCKSPCRVPCRADVVEESVVWEKGRGRNGDTEWFGCLDVVCGGAAVTH